jgi:uncharacterized protein (TIGR03437 family)
VAGAGGYSVKLVAGSDWVGDGGPPLEAILLQAEGLALDPSGALYISDAQSHRVRAITPGGVIRTVAGTGSAGFSGDGGLAAEAQLNAPYGLATDTDGNLYIADLGNARVRLVSPEGIISTIAGGAGDLSEPRDVAVDSSGGLYIADFNAHRVYHLDSGGTLRSVAGTGVAGLSRDGGSATLAELDHPAAVASGGQGVFYIGDTGNHRVLKVENGVVSTIAQVAAPTGLAVDTSRSLYVADAFGAQILRIPDSGVSAFVPASGREIAFGPDGSLYSSDGRMVRRMFPGGASGLIAGGRNRAHGDGGPAADARLNRPVGLALDRDGNLYIADRGNHRVRKVSEGTITTSAGTGTPGYTGNIGTAQFAALNSPAAVSVDTADNLFIVDSGNQRIRLVTPFGIIFALATIPDARAIATDPLGHIYVAAGRQIIDVVPPGVPLPVLTDLENPEALAVASDGTLYFIDDAGHGLGRRTIDGIVTHTRDEARNLRGIAVTPHGEVFVVDQNSSELLAANAGLDLISVELDGPIGSPSAIASGPDGTLYVADTAADRVWALTHVPLEAVHAATGVAGPVAPGMLLAIRGMKLLESEVRIGGLPAPVLSLRGLEAIVEVPAGIAGLEEAAIEVFDQGVQRATFTVPVAAASPGLFTDGSGRALATNHDSSLNTPANPAERGCIIVLYGTGQGIAGWPVTVQIGGIIADLLYSGPVLGYPGLWQINTRIPATPVTIGAVAVTVIVGNSISPTVTIAIK